MKLLSQNLSSIFILKNITDNKLSKKVAHSMSDLIKNRYVEAKHMTSDSNDNLARIELSDIGHIEVKYVM